MSELPSINELVQKAILNRNKAQEEIKNFTLKLLESHWFDNLSNMITQATNRGFVAIEWIDFWGVGIIDSQITIDWAYKVIYNQGMKDIIEPYYNNINHRLGIILNRTILQEKKLLKQGSFLTLPLELQKK